jgi:hypothetical protein
MILFDFRILDTSRQVSRIDRREVCLGSRLNIQHVLDFKRAENNDRLVARPTRIDAQGGWYHVVNRGIEHRAIFKDEKSGPIREAIASGQETRKPSKPPSKPTYKKCCKLRRDP